MMAAYAAASGGHRVRLLEKNEKLGKKIYITGKGRCNVTNACDLQTYINNVVSNPKFMYSAFRALEPDALMSLIESAGTELKTERGNRVFPVSDHASDITKALTLLMRNAGAEVLLNTEVKDIRIKDDIPGSANAVSPGAERGFEVIAEQGKYRRVFAANAVIVCTGGLSYPSTGSTGDGYRWAERFGLPLVKCTPALVPLTVESGMLQETEELQGVSLKNVAVRIPEAGFDEQGEMLFTHFGLSGPLILSASSLISRKLSEGKHFQLEIDLKPALDEETLDKRILRDFESARNQSIGNALAGLLISSLRPVILRRCGIDPVKKVHDISREERSRLVSVIKHLSYTVTGTRGFNEAIITQGGVSVGAVNAKTMECRNIPGLYFAGEVLDVDAYTGGFNLQTAFSMGFAAGSSL